MFSDATIKYMLHAVTWISILLVHFYDSSIALIIYIILICVAMVLFVIKLLFLHNCAVFDGSEESKVPPLHWHVIGLFVEAVVFITILEMKDYSGISMMTAAISFLGFYVIYLFSKGATGSAIVWECTLKPPQS